jgi:hypothetical protein
MKVLTSPLPQAFTSPYLRNRTRVQADTPDLTPLMWNGARSVSDIDRIIYRDSRGILCYANGACIEFSGRATIVMLFQQAGKPLASWRRELAVALGGPDRHQVALVAREGDDASRRAVEAATAALRPGEALLLEEKKATEILSIGERRVLAGLNSHQPQECWVVVTDTDGTLHGAVSANGALVLRVADFRRHIERHARKG